MSTKYTFFLLPQNILFFMHTCLNSSVPTSMTLIFALIVLIKRNKWNLFLSASFWNHFSKGDTSFSTLFHQFHKALTRHYADGGENLYNPSKMESFCEEHAPGMFEDIFDAIFNNEKRTPSQKRRNLQKSRVVAVLHNLSFFRNQVLN